MANSIFITCYITSIAIFGIAMIVFYFKKYKGLSINIWKPGAAWMRALIYFSFCNIVMAIRHVRTNYFSTYIYRRTNYKSFLDNV